MKSVLNRERIYQWLGNEITTLPTIEAYVFGSILDIENNSPNDVDLFVSYKSERISQVIQLKTSTQKRFFAEFGLELHLLLLTDEETNQFGEFLQKALSASKCIKQSGMSHFNREDYSFEAQEKEDLDFSCQS